MIHFSQGKRAALAVVVTHSAQVDTQEVLLTPSPRLDASLNNGWVSTPLPMHRRMGACILPEQGHPDKTGRNISEGFYTSTKGKWVNYSGESFHSRLLSITVPDYLPRPMMMNLDFIPGYLQPETQLALRREMIKPISESDESVYVYAYLIEGMYVSECYVCRPLLVHQDAWLFTQRPFCAPRITTCPSYCN